MELEENKEKGQEESTKVSMMTSMTVDNEKATFTVRTCQCTRQT